MSENVYKFNVNGKEYSVQILSLDNNEAQVIINGRVMKININSLPLLPSSNVVVVNPGAKITPKLPIMAGTGIPATVKAPVEEAQQEPVYKKTARKTTVFAQSAEPAEKAVAAKNPVKAPLPGLILDIKVKVGDSVNVGDVILVMEAMKMENEIRSHAAGTITQIFVKKEQSVSEGAPLIDIE